MRAVVVASTAVRAVGSHAELTCGLCWKPACRTSNLPVLSLYLLRKAICREVCEARLRLGPGDVPTMTAGQETFPGHSENGHLPQGGCGTRDFRQVLDKGSVHRSPWRGPQGPPCQVLDCFW